MTQFCSPITKLAALVSVNTTGSFHADELPKMAVFWGTTSTIQDSAIPITGTNTRLPLTVVLMIQGSQPSAAYSAQAIVEGFSAREVKIAPYQEIFPPH
jgi:hypothetical protein